MKNFFFKISRQMLIFAMTGVVLSGCADKSVFLNNMYQYIHSRYPVYDGKTYAAPSKNYLNSQWQIQTPNIWGEDVDQYNNSFKIAHGQKLDKEFEMPTCTTSKDCSGNSVCTMPDYTKDQNGHKKSLCTVPADQILSKIYQEIVSANHSVDITTLEPGIFVENQIATKAFLGTIKNALIALAKKTILTGQPIKVRMIQGEDDLDYSSTFVQKNPDFQKNLMQKNVENMPAAIALYSQKTFLENIVNDLPKGNHLDISIATMISCAKLFGKCSNSDIQSNLKLNFAWNHGKIIDVDSKTLITGGHNLWGDDYLQKNPVNDFSLEIAGPVVNGATSYVNALWDYTCSHKGHFFFNIVKTYENLGYSNTCLDDTPLMNNFKDISSKNAFTVMAMPIAKLNNGVLGANADESELARVYAFNHAKKNIKISQQAMYTTSLIGSSDILHPLATIDGTVMQALANALLNGVEVKIVTSTLKNDGYTSYVPLSYIWTALETILKNKHNLTTQQARAILLSKLYLGAVSFDGKYQAARSHNKLWIVDDELFYVGSHNIYPSSLQQFGVIIDSKKAAADIEKNLWNHLWSNSLKYVPSYA